MMLLAASPGGTSANLFSHLFRGDVALNVTLTAINSIIAIVSLPIITNLAIAHYDQSDTVSLQFGKVIEVFAIVLVPVAIGMLVRAKAPAFAARADKGVRIGSAVILAVLVIGILLDQRENVADYLADVGLVAALFCAASLVVGYVIPKALGIVEGQAIASSMEIGVHNATLAIFVAVEVLEATEISIPAAVYSLFMFVFAALWGSFISRRVDARVHGRLTTGLWITAGFAPDFTPPPEHTGPGCRMRHPRSVGGSRTMTVPASVPAFEPGPPTEPASDARPTPQPTTGPASEPASDGPLDRAAPSSEPGPSTEPVPPGVKAQILATEHWSLLASRSMTWSEVMSRITIHLTIASASLVVLALFAQASGFGGAFRVMAIGLAAAVLVMGTLTQARVVNASIDDSSAILGMNRLRAGYLEIDPSLAPYFVTSAHDDQQGLMDTYLMGWPPLHLQPRGRQHEHLPDRRQRCRRRHLGSAGHQHAPGRAGQW